MYYPRPGWVELDMKQVWQRTQECIHEALDAAGAGAADVAAIGSPPGARPRSAATCFRNAGYLVVVEPDGWPGRRGARHRPDQRQLHASTGPAAESPAGGSGKGSFRRFAAVLANACGRTVRCPSPEEPGLRSAGAGCRDGTGYVARLRTGCRAARERPAGARRRPADGCARWRSARRFVSRPPMSTYVDGRKCRHLTHATVPGCGHTRG
jgi:hypothetical protein